MNEAWHSFTTAEPWQILHSSITEWDRLRDCRIHRAAGRRDGESQEMGYIKQMNMSLGAVVGKKHFGSEKQHLFSLAHSRQQDVKPAPIP